MAPSPKLSQEPSKWHSLHIQLEDMQKRLLMNQPLLLPCNSTKSAPHPAAYGLNNIGRCASTIAPTSLPSSTICAFVGMPLQYFIVPSLAYQPFSVFSWAESIQQLQIRMIQLGVPWYCSNIRTTAYILDYDTDTSTQTTLTAWSTTQQASWIMQQPTCLWTFMPDTKPKSFLWRSQQ